MKRPFHTNQKKDIKPVRLPASQNARTHGLFSQELTLSGEEWKDFRRLERNLRRELVPSSELLNILFDDVVYSAWRMKVALRLEQNQVRKYLETDYREAAVATVDDGPPLRYPFPLRRRELERRVKLLDAYQQEIHCGSLHSDKWEEWITEAFGQEFWKSVTKWRPLNLIPARLFEFVIRRDLEIGPHENPLDEEPKKQFDPLALEEMQLKLVAMKRQQLLEALHLIEELPGGQAMRQGAEEPLDLYLRYQTAVRRDFYRALQQYREMKKDPAHPNADLKLGKAKSRVVG